MLTFFMIVFLAPFVVGGIAFTLSENISLKEFGLMALLAGAVAWASMSIVSCSNTSDTEVWNGTVTSKQQNRVSCSHSYPCNCRQSCTSDSKGNQSCITICDTCYDHMWDYDWDVYTSNKETITIARVDRQGVNEPPRFTATRIGEPTSVQHEYKNYIKAAPGTLFRHQGMKEKYGDKVPPYPQDIYDYYRLDRLVTVDVEVVDRSSWNADLSRINADLGMPKQVNVIVVLVRNKTHDWYYALEESWVGGKKNDAVLVVSVSDDLKPQWVEVMAWTSNELFKVKLRDDIMDLPVVRRDLVINALETNVSQRYVRKPMKDFEYLTAEATPTMLQWSVTLFVALVVCGGLMFFFHTQGARFHGRFGRRMGVVTLRQFLYDQFSNH